jgi:hypothetical protein
MTSSRLIVWSKKFQQPKRTVSLMLLSALLATQMLVADVRAESSPSLVLAVNLHSPEHSLSATQVDNKKSRASSADRQNRGCWETRLRAGRWKRTNVCFLEGKNSRAAGAE